jgi:phage FluMu gp28-like protein
MKELAKNLDSETDALLSRWEGRPDYLMEDIFRVRDLDTKDIEPLSLTDYQKQFVHAFFYGEESTINVLKGRRTGYSFIACACILLDAILTSHGFYAITGPSKSQAKERIEDVYDLMEWSRLNFDNLPVDNRDEIQLPNGAKIMAFSGNPDTSRGADSADVLFIDEMDFLDDQQESMRAFSPFVALGDAQTVEISTPERENGLFMQDHQAGSANGDNGIISIYQPAFNNASEIDETVSLLEQETDIAMPYLDIEQAERDRARDPKGFRQEYLCEPVEDSYRFFDEATVKGAIERGSDDSYRYGPTAGAVEGGTLYMGVDIAGGGKDDTAVVLVEHVNDNRYLRYHETVDNSTLKQAGVEPAVARNPSAIAKRINQLYRANNVDHVITDATNIGEGFDSEIRQVIGRGVQSFNFSDKESVADMMGDLNYGLHNGQVTLVPDDQLRDQLLAIVKDKRRKGSKPRFSGKDHSPDGKDDVAIAFALAAYPPTMNGTPRALQQQDGDDMEPVDEIALNSSTESDNTDTGHRGATLSSNASRNLGRNGRYKRRYKRS